MNKMIQAIATVMIVLLLVVLIWIFISYYKNNDVVDTISYPSGNSNLSVPGIPNTDYILDGKENYNYDNLIESIQNMSGEKETSNRQEENESQETSTSGNELTENTNSGDKTKENENQGKEDPIQQPDSPVNQQEPDNQLVISSDPKTSNEEKQEVLTEIDEALKGLLEAVGKVEIVDETRLDATLNSEVEIP